MVHAGTILLSVLWIHTPDCIVWNVQMDDSSMRCRILPACLGLITVEPSITHRRWILQLFFLFFFFSSSCSGAAMGVQKNSRRKQRIGLTGSLGGGGEIKVVKGLATDSPAQTHLHTWVHFFFPQVEPTSPFVFKAIPFPLSVSHSSGKDKGGEGGGRVIPWPGPFSQAGWTENKIHSWLLFKFKCAVTPLLCLGVSEGTAKYLN